MDSRGRFSKINKKPGPEITPPGDELLSPRCSKDQKLAVDSEGLSRRMKRSRPVCGKNARTAEPLWKTRSNTINSNSDILRAAPLQPRSLLASNRDGGKGDDDIYTFINEDPDLAGKLRPAAV